MGSLGDMTEPARDVQTLGYAKDAETMRWLHRPYVTDEVGASRYADFQIIPFKLNPVERYSVVINAERSPRDANGVTVGIELEESSGRAMKC